MKTINKYAPYLLIMGLALNDSCNNESLQTQIEDAQNNPCDAARAEIQMVQQKILDAGLTLETAQSDVLKVDACKTISFAWEMHDLLQVRMLHVCGPEESNVQVQFFLEESIDPNSLSNAHMEHCRD